MTSYHWADRQAEEIIEKQGEKEEYTLAAGITPSGIIHIGNFREIITVDLVNKALQDKGKDTKFLYIWDDYDALRKVPDNLPNKEMIRKNMRKPVAFIPDPLETHDNYADHFESKLEAHIPQLDINPEYIYQYKRYIDRDYSEHIKESLDNIPEIKEILNQYRKEPLEEDWLPITVYCEECGKDTTEINQQEDYEISYYCTNCEHEDTFDFREKGLAKLKWRLDWPTRWDYDEIDFEPGGKDHLADGGSYDTASEIVQKIWDKKPPLTQGYGWIKGKEIGEFASSEGKVITLNEMLEVYEPEIIRYLFASTRPESGFEIAFDEEVIKIYEDFDTCEKIYYGEEKADNEKEKKKQERIYELSNIEEPPEEKPLQEGFRHLTVLVQIYEMDVEKTLERFKDEISNDYELRRLRQRIRCAKNWIEDHAPEKYIFEVQDTVPENISLDDKQKESLREIAKVLRDDEELNAEELHQEFYNVFSDLGLSAGAFFQGAYKVLLNKDSGPRLASFVKELGEERVAKLFEQI